MLKFHEEPFSSDEEEVILDEFRRRGFVVLPDVFEKSSVDPFREAVLASLTGSRDSLQLPDDSPFSLQPTFAPRIRQMLSPALSSRQIRPYPSICEIRWRLQAAEASCQLPGWHKDRDPDGMPGTEYHFPLEVSVGMYFEDMAEEMGPTIVVPGSHRDQALTPHGTSAPVEPFSSRKQDVVLWDKRLWHRGSARTIPGVRIFAVFSFFAVPVYQGAMPTQPMAMTEAHRRALANSINTGEEVLYGGVYRPSDKDGDS